MKQMRLPIVAPVRPKMVSTGMGERKQQQLKQPESLEEGKRA